MLPYVYLNELSDKITLNLIEIIVKTATNKNLYLKCIKTEIFWFIFRE